VELATLAGVAAAGHLVGIFANLKILELLVELPLALVLRVVCQGNLPRCGQALLAPMNARSISDGRIPVNRDGRLFRRGVAAAVAMLRGP